MHLSDRSGGDRVLVERGEYALDVVMQLLKHNLADERQWKARSHIVELRQFVTHFRREEVSAHCQQLTSLQPQTAETFQGLPAPGSGAGTISPPSEEGGHACADGTKQYREEEADADPARPIGRLWIDDGEGWFWRSGKQGLGMNFGLST